MRKCVPFFMFLLACIDLSWAQTWDQLVKVVPDARAASDNFGRSVSVSGNFAIVGAYKEDEDASDLNTLSDAGSAYIFQYNGSTWELQQKLVASDRAASDYFGYSVAISGNYAIVGAFQEDQDALDGNTLSNAGSAYIFHYNGTTWEQQQKLVSTDRAIDDNFGYSVAISGEYAVIGAHNEDEDEALENTINSAGSAYIFKFNGSNWAQVQKIVGINRFSSSRFGSSVAISDSLIAVGTSNCWDPSGANQILNAGAAYIFNLTTGSVWAMQQKIVPQVRARDDYFGYSVSLSNTHLLVGAYQEDEDSVEANTLSNSGSAYLFKKNGSTWEQQAKIAAPDRQASDNFGFYVSISNNYALIGANNEDEDALEGNTLSNAGSAYLFELGENGWEFRQKLVAGDRASSDFFGISVSISNETALIGAWYEDEDANNENTRSAAGSAYFFAKTYPEDPIKSHFILNDSTIQQGETACFNAYDTLTIAGSEGSVHFDTLSTVTLIAGKLIRFFPGFHARAGSVVHAFITPDSSFCVPEEKSLLITNNQSQIITSLGNKMKNGGEKMKNQIKLSPNPTSGRFDLEIAGIEGPVQVLVTNPLGKVVSRWEGENQYRHTFDFTSMNKGLYLVTILRNNERHSAKVLVK